MAEVVTLHTKMAHKAPAPIEAPHPTPYAGLPTDVLMQQLVDTLIEVRTRSNQSGFNTTALADAHGRVWGMRALVNLCKNYFTHIALRAER